MSLAKSFAALSIVALVASCGWSAPDQAPPSHAPTAESAGDVVGKRPLTDVDAEVAAVAGWSGLVTYSSHYAVDDSWRHVTTSVYAPAGPPPPEGFPIVALARAVDGTGGGCGPTTDDGPVISDLLHAGYVVTVPDYQGFGRPSDGQSNAHPFLDSVTAARNVTDAVRAARNVVGRTSPKWAVLGTAEGGQAAWAADEFADSYGYDLDLRGAVAISPTADVGGLVDAAVAGTLTPAQTFAYVAYLDALAKEYPDEFRLDDYRRGAVARQWDLLLSCRLDSAAQRAAAAAAASPDDLRPASPAALSALRGLLLKTVLPQGPTSAPMYVAYGGREPLIPAAWTDAALRRACGMGDAITVHRLPDEAAPVGDPAGALGWIADRFRDAPLVDDCGHVAAAPSSHAAPASPAAPAPAVAQPVPTAPAPTGTDAEPTNQGPSLIGGWLPLALQVVAGVLVLVAIGWRTRRWRRRWLPIGALAGLTVAALSYGYVDLQGWGGDTPTGTWAWLAVTGLAAAVAILGWRGAAWWRRVVSLLAVPLAALSALAVLNASLGYVPTVRAAWERAVDAPPPGIVDQQVLAAMVRDGARPGHGTVVSVEIPSDRSGFAHRSEFVYLPPAWFAATPPPRLPAVVMVGPELGNPGDWLDAGNARRVLDAYAQSHRGVTPVVVFPDSTGSFTNDTECVDGPRGKAADHLTEDVVPYVISHFGVDADPTRWAVAGWSTGGTCALTLGVMHPELFRTVVTLDGQLGPNAGNHAQTVARLFGGDEAAWAAFDPKSVVRAHGPYTGTSVWVGVSGRAATVHPPVGGPPPTDDALGEWDPASEEHAAGGRQLCLLLSGYGIDCGESSYAGTHDFPSAGIGFAAALPWLAGRISTPGSPAEPMPMPPSAR